MLHAPGADDDVNDERRAGPARRQRRRHRRIVTARRAGGHARGTARAGRGVRARGRAHRQRDRARGELPAPLIGLGVLVALAALCGGAYALARWRAWEPDWALRTRHAAAEASWRASNTWAEFSDWLRFGQR